MITRVEIIDRTQTDARVYSRQDIQDAWVSYQDDGRTLKVFINESNQGAHNLRTISLNAENSFLATHQALQSAENSFMLVKDNYSELCRALGFEGDAFWGDPLADHEEIVARAEELNGGSERILTRAREILDKEIEIYGTDKHGISYEQLEQIVNK